MTFQCPNISQVEGDATERSTLDVTQCKEDVIENLTASEFLTEVEHPSMPSDII